MTRVGGKITISARKTFVLPLLDAADFVKKSDIPPVKTTQ